MTLVAYVARRGAKGGEGGPRRVEARAGIDRASNNKFGDRGDLLLGANAMRIWFIFSWLLAFPLGCALCTLSFVDRSTMSGGNRVVFLDNPGLFLVTMTVFGNVGFATICFVKRRSGLRALNGNSRDVGL